MSGGTYASWVMTDHLSWTIGQGTAFRVVRNESAVWLLRVTPIVEAGSGVRTEADRVSGGESTPTFDIFDPAGLVGPDELVTGLQAMGPVARWRNPDLWDAIAAAVLRHEVCASRARTLYQDFCRAHGQQVSTSLGEAFLVPTPDTVSTLSAAEFERLGLACKQRALRAAAQAFLKCGAQWAALGAGELFCALQMVPRVGPWTAGAAVADLTNDYERYPFDDLAVRTFARQLAPGCNWPGSGHEFASGWVRLAGDQLGAWTLLTLAWGNRYANSVELEHGGRQ